MRPKSRLTAITLLAGALGALALVQPATARENGPVSVSVNMARILRIGSPAATVIVGNPGVADVTIQDPKTLILTGKSYGKTNLIVLDNAGNPIADTIVQVVASDKDMLTVYMGDQRATMACAPTCQPVIMLGDDPSYTSSTASSASLVQSSAK